MGRARALDDNWFGVQDPRKRKQIQDRLAQRARRMRLAEAKKSVEERFSEAHDCESASDESPSRITSISTVGSESRVRVVSHRPVTTVPRQPSGQQIMAATSTADSCVIATLSSSIYGALYQNGALMGISCAVSCSSKSCAVGPDIPESLRPTELQLTVVHPRWIDRFPFPKMRDNIITLLGIIDEEEFMGDLFRLTSFTLDAGAAPWDPTAWRIGKEFSAKWGYLFY
ncbi:hypothetical protein PV04_06413 [Phialophora macrospora]|uniref:BZIP domain-containing protein n=1 Tax=Phialophora macrospora TaxID=1851006 RepID=A0A0D2CPP2_9EURO|nr:hypothetical protein PV04_06413 [Phialophora macrospora]